MPYEAQPWPGLKRRSHWFQLSGLELDLYKRFAKALQSGPKIEVEGFVSRLGGRNFMLRPSPAILESIACDGSNLRDLPTDNQFVRVRGRRGIRVTKRGTVGLADVVEVDDCEQVRLPPDRLKPDIGFKDASELLFDTYLDLPSALKAGLTLAVTSSPRDRFRVGGLTTTLLPLDDRHSSSLASLLRDMKKKIPVDLTSEGAAKVTVRGEGEVEASTFPWGVHVGGSWELSTSAQEALLLRTKAASPGIREMTVGVSSNVVAPTALDELWIRKSDLPYLVDKLDRLADPGPCDIELAKYLITVHANAPHVSKEVDINLFDLVKGRLAKFKRKYDPEGLGGLVDFDVLYGTPRSILHVSESLARAEGSDEVKPNHLEEALSLYESSYEYLFESWLDRGYRYPSQRVNDKLEYVDSLARRVYDFVYRNPNAAKSEIREAFSRVSSTVFEKTFRLLEDDALIYRSSSEDERYSAVD